MATSVSADSSDNDNKGLSLKERWDKRVVETVGEEAAKEGIFATFDRKIAESFQEQERKKNQSTYDIPDLSSAQAAKIQYYQDRSQSTWKERLKYMWTPDEFGFFSPELEFVSQGTFMSFIGAAVYGSWQESAKIHRIFIEQNKYTMFQHPREAQRALQDRIVLAMVQGGWRAGWRLGLLTFTMTSVCQSLTVIRNYINPLDYAVGGAISGAVYRFNMGPRGMIGAGTLGSILGLGAGLTTAGVQYISGETVEERWHREFQRIEDKKRLKEEAIAKKDVRGQEIQEDQRPKESRVVLQEDSRSVNFEPSEHRTFRNMTMQITAWLHKVGLLAYPGNDAFQIEARQSEESDKSESSPR